MRFCTLTILFSLLFISCNKNKKHSIIKNQNNSKDVFIDYLIKSGNNFCENDSIVILDYIDSLNFMVIFDSSCIYTNVDPTNQFDINKLMGFSDCGTHHQVNSARFGWNWLEGSIHIYAYCYNNEIRDFKLLDTVSLNTPYLLKMYLRDNQYCFSLKNKEYTMSRHCSDNKIFGYQLFPYFGGDETAPHNILIKIKYLYKL
jgi:hypothetical protein